MVSFVRSAIAVVFMASTVGKIPKHYFDGVGFGIFRIGLSMVVHQKRELADLVGHIVS